MIYDHTTYNRAIAFESIGNARNNGREIFQLLDDLIVTVTLEGVEHEITVPKGFQTDFASPPNVPLSLLCFPLDLHDVDLDVPTCVHDWLCQNYDFTKPDADSALAQLLKQAGVGWYRRFWINLFVAHRAARVQWNQPNLKPLVLYGKVVGWTAIPAA